MPEIIPDKAKAAGARIVATEKRILPRITGRKVAEKLQKLLEEPHLDQQHK